MPDVKMLRPGEAFARTNERFRVRFPDARLMWETTVRQTMPPMALFAYRVGGTLVILQVWGDGGWNAFVEASDSTSIEKTYEAVERVARERTPGGVGA